MEKLLPCPFCGGKPYYREGVFDEEEIYRKSYKIWCSGCNAEIELSPGKDHKIKIDPILTPQELYDKICESILITNWNYRTDINNLNHAE